MQDELGQVSEFVGLLRLQVDLLQAKIQPRQLEKSILAIDDMLARLNEEKTKLATSDSLDPLVPIKYLIEHHFSIEEMNDLAFESGINPEQISGETVKVRARELVMYADRNGLLSVLLGTCEIKRPFIDWPQ